MNMFKNVKWWKKGVLDIYVFFGMWIVKYLLVCCMCVLIII